MGKTRGYVPAAGVDRESSDDELREGGGSVYDPSAQEMEEGMELRPLGKGGLKPMKIGKRPPRRVRWICCSVCCTLGAWRCACVCGAAAPRHHPAYCALHAAAADGTFRGWLAAAAAVIALVAVLSGTNTGREIASAALQCRAENHEEFHRMFADRGWSDHPRPAAIKENLRELTRRPHLAGTRNDLATAEYVRDQMLANGWDSHLVRYDVLLMYPKVDEERRVPYAELSGRCTPRRTCPGMRCGGRCVLLVCGLFLAEIYLWSVCSGQEINNNIETPRPRPATPPTAASTRRWSSRRRKGTLSARRRAAPHRGATPPSLPTASRPSTASLRRLSVSILGGPFWLRFTYVAPVLITKY
jgi:hypothetical protein